MSHELRTPLNSILGFSQLLEMSDLDETQRDNVAHVLRAGEHLLAMINEVLDIAKIETGRVDLTLAPADLASIVAFSTELTRPMLAAQELELIKNVPSVPVLADEQALRQVLVNVLTNAIKYNRLGGRIEIVAQTFGTGRVRLEIRDTGVGIAAELLPRLFVPFDRLGAQRSKVQGTGLGLTLSKSLVEAMDGTIEVTSDQGVGTTVSIELALAPVRGELELRSAA